MLGCPRHPSNSEKHHSFCKWYLFGSTAHYWEGRQPKVSENLKPQNSWRWTTWNQVSNKESMHHVGPVPTISAHIYVMWLYGAYTLMCFQNLPSVCTPMMLNSQHWSTPINMVHPIFPTKIYQRFSNDYRYRKIARNNFELPPTY